MGDPTRKERVITPKLKAELVHMFLKYKSLQFGNFKTKRGWNSPYFINTGTFDSGEALIDLVAFYVFAIRLNFEGISCIYGPAYKGIPLCVAIATALQRHSDHPVRYTFDRKEAKLHGEATPSSSTFSAPSNPKSFFVGHVPTAKDKVLVVDDVVSSGQSLQKAIDDLKQLNVPVEGVLVLVDREEPIDDDNKILARDFFEQQNIPFYSLVTASEIVAIVKEHLSNKVDAKAIARLESYIRARKSADYN